MATQKILVPVDGSTHSKRALEVAADLALHFGAEIMVLHVVHGGTPRVPADVAAYERYERIHLTQHDLLAASGEEIIEDAEKILRDAGVLDITLMIEVGNPAGIIVETARAVLAEDDMIVMGRRGLSNLPALLLGSVSQKVAHLVDKTLITVK